MTKRLTRRRIGLTLILAAVSLFGLSASAFGDPGSASFKVDVTPGSQSVAQGQSTSYAVVLTAKKTFSGFIDLSTDPAALSGVTLSFSANHVHLNPGAAAALTLTLTLSLAAHPDTLDFKVIGHSGSQISQDTVKVKIKEAAVPFLISGNAEQQLSPGETVPIDLTLTNPGNKKIKITELTIALGTLTLANGHASGACVLGEDYDVVQYSGDYPLKVPAGGHKTLTQLRVPSGQWPKVSMRNLDRVQNACAGSQLTLTYSGTAIVNDGEGD